MEDAGHSATVHINTEHAKPLILQYKQIRDVSRHVRLTFLQRNLFFSCKTTTATTDSRNSMGKTHQSWTLLTRVQYLLILLGDPAVHHGLSSPSALLDRFFKAHFLFLSSSSLLVMTQIEVHELEISESSFWTFTLNYLFCFIIQCPLAKLWENS